MAIERVCEDCGETKPFAIGTWSTSLGKPRGKRCLACSKRKGEVWLEKSRAISAAKVHASSDIKPPDMRRQGERRKRGAPLPPERICKDCGESKAFAKNTWVTSKGVPCGWRCLSCAITINNKWAAANREHAAQKALAWRNENIEYAREREAAWYRENPEVNIRKAHMRRARIKEVGGRLSKGITSVTGQPAA